MYDFPHRSLLQYFRMARKPPRITQRRDVHVILVFHYNYISADIKFISIPTYIAFICSLCARNYLLKSVGLSPNVTY